jgi:hypothetical protein
MSMVMHQSVMKARLAYWQAIQAAYKVHQETMDEAWEVYRDQGHIGNLIFKEAESRADDILRVASFAALDAYNAAIELIRRGVDDA